MKTNTYIIFFLYDYFYKIVFVFLLLYSYSSKAQTTLDDFTDGDYTANPTWTIFGTGTVSISSNALLTNTSVTTGLIMSTPFIQTSSEWGFTVKSSTSFNTDLFRYYFILKDNANPSNATSDGYFVQFDGNSGDFYLYRQDNGNETSPTLLGSYNAAASSSTQTIKITRDVNNLFTVFINGTNRITATDGTYSNASVQFQAIRVVEIGSTATYTVDNIYYIASCENPTSGGIISGTQSSCGSFNPSAITSSSLPTGQTGTLEYKWQQSTTSSSTGFSDITSSNNSTYDPPTITQTTWYKRLARVSCKTDWTGAVESNVVEINISSAILCDGIPFNDTIYNEMGNASFGVSLVNPSGASYQWQVSIDNGSSWSNLSNGGVYSGVTDSILQITNPTYSMNGYLYRCLASNACGSVNSGNGAKLNVIQLSTFSNTTITNCSDDLGAVFGTTFERVITVSGLPAPLGNSSGKYVLRQINLKLGNTTCEKNLSSYAARLVSPAGTVIELFDNSSSTNITGNPSWMDIKFRDHESLERLEQYTTTVQTFYFPYSIGYYAIQNDGDFNNLIGENPNGDWRLQITENTTDEITFERIDIIFGPALTITDVTSTSSNNECSQSTCINSQEIIIASNNAYSEGDTNYPGSPISACSWNGANNNSSWFKFTASSTSAYITLSGLRAIATGSNDMQPIVFSRSGGCNSGTFNVPNGGCPDDISRNNTEYLSANGGGTSSSPYSSGITANTEFTLSGLTVGQTYYLYVDGNGGSSSSFYIEMANGAQTCRTLLPVELTYFKANYNFPFAHLTWRTESELNNDRFEIEKSVDGLNWKYISNIKGKGTTNVPQDYAFIDEEIIEHITYYRLKQLDFNGEYSYSSIEIVNPYNAENSLFYPNPANDEIIITLPSENEIHYQIIDQLGRTILNGTNPAGTKNIFVQELETGIYFLFINNTCFGKLVKK
jgi:hypothetical protein